MFVIESLLSNKEEILILWFLVSDGVEQIPSYLRIGHHHGTKTNLSFKDVLYAARTWSANLKLDGKALHLLKITTSHSRGKTLIPSPFPTVLYSLSVI
jgi:hypothetical protein